MIPKMGKKLRTASRNSKFTGSYKNCIAFASGMGGYFVDFIRAVNTKTCEWFLSWHRLLCHIRVRYIKTLI